VRRDIAGLATREEVQQIRNLVQEFQNELTTLGVEVDAVRRRLDALEGRVGLLEDEVKRVRIGGAVNLMARGNHRQGSGVRGIVDRDGFRVTGGRGSEGSLLADTRVLHDLDLNIKARLSETATAEAVLNFGNYLPFLNSITSHTGARSTRGNSLNPALNQFVNQSQEQTIYKLALEAPIRLPGLGGVALTVGRIPVQFTPYTLRLIDVDTYFYNDKTDLGDIPVDGAKGTFKLGPVGVTAFAAKADPIKHVSDSNGNIIGTTGSYGLYAGASSSPFNGGFRGNSVTFRDENNVLNTTGNRPRGSLIRPIGTGPEPILPATGNGAMPVENIAGVRATFGTGFLGTVGATYIAMGGPSQAPGTFTNADFNRVYVYGADINTAIGPFGVNASYTKSDTAGRKTSDPTETTSRVDEDNEAYELGGNISFGPLAIAGGYRYIGPFFAAPGYWEKLGEWTNPIDIQGPFVKASYALGGGIALTAEGHFYEGTGDAVGAGGLSGDDGITHYKAGLKYGLTSASTVDLGVEYSKYDLRNRGESPTSIFYNIGYGFSFNPTTSLKLLYQIVDYRDKGTGFDTQNSRGGVAAAQFQVKF